MGAVYFYHLTESAPEEALPLLVDRARAAGWRVLVRAGDDALLDRLDTALWQGPPEAFPAHGRSGGPHDAAQPVLLGRGEAAEFDCVMALDGAPLVPEEVEALARACVIFDGRDGAAVQAARGQWKTLTGAGLSAQYWAQEDGRWVKKAESGGEG